MNFHPQFSPPIKSIAMVQLKKHGILKQQSVKRYLQAALLLCVVTVAQAITPFKIADIRVDGVQRVEPSTVFTYLPVKVGDQLDDSKVRESIRALYATGLFVDVAIDTQGDVMLVTVQERPTIAAISLVGNKEFETADIKKILSEAGLSESRPYDRAVVARAEEALKKAYLSKSKYALKVTTTSSPVDRNRVNVLLEFNEGEFARIREIKIIGNQAFTEKQILAEISSRTPGMFTWLTKSDRYGKEKIEADVEAIRNFYLNQGYFEFNVESNQVNLSPNQAEVFVTITIKEGDRFTLNTVTVKSQLAELQAPLDSVKDIRTGTVFNGEAMNKQLAKFSNKLGELGYASPNINLVPDVDKANKRLSFTVDVEAGQITYVRNVLVNGNSKTRDVVVRREILQLEAAAFDAEKVRQSRDKIDRLGFFKDVIVDTLPVDQRPDLIDVVFTVSEKATGSLSFGLGFNSTDKVALSAGISQDNIFGSGNNLAFNVNTAKLNRGLSLSAVDPYFTAGGISRAFDVYARENRLQTNAVDTTRIKTAGLATRFGIPLSKDDVAYFGAGVEYTGLKVFAAAPQRYVDLNNQIGGSAVYPLFTAGWGSDTRDSNLSPSTGVLKRANLELGTGSEIGFAKATYQYQRYLALNKDFTVAVNADIGYGKGFGNKAYPFFKNFLVGGIGSVRGYQGNSLGTLDGLDYIGGSKKAVLNAELLFPLPGTGKDRSARLFTFVDGGYAWADGQKISATDMRYSAGVGLSWLSPIGPLKFSYGLPIKKNVNDKLQKFQFQIGTGF